MQSSVNFVNVARLELEILCFLLIHCDWFSSTDLLRLERENKQLTMIIDNLKTGIPVDKIKQLKESNDQMSENMFQYKNMITTLTKVCLVSVVIIIIVVVLIFALKK